jgi:hypothetical protein
LNAGVVTGVAVVGGVMVRSCSYKLREK